MKTLEDLSPAAKKKLSTTITIFGSLTTIAAVVLVIMEQDASILQALLLITGSMFILTGSLIGRNTRQCPEEDTGTESSRDSES